MKKISLFLLLFLCGCDRDKSINPQPYTDLTGKIEITCPTQTSQTLVLYTFGQSNSSNSLEKKYTNSDQRIINYFQGKCYIAEDPLLGATGDRGSQWVVTAQKLMTRGTYDYIVINSFGIGGSGIGQWVNGGNLVPYYDLQVQTIYTPTHFLWHQGESDAARNTGTQRYAEMLTTLINKSFNLYPSSKFYVSLATICEGPPSPPIREAQASVVNNTNIFQGPDTDAISDRYDNCHIGQMGQEQVSDMWLNLL